MAGVPNLLASFESLERPAARHRWRHLVAEVKDPLVEQSVLYKRDKILEFVLGKFDRSLQQRIDPGSEDSVEGADPEVGGYVVGTRVVVPQRRPDIQVVCDRRRDRAKRAVVEESARGFQVPQRTRPEGVPIHLIARRLLEAEVFVLPRTVVDHVARADAEYRRELWAADPVVFEVAEHLVRLAGNRMTGHAVRLAEKQQRAMLFAGRHRAGVAASKPVDRRARGRQERLKFRDRLPPHADRDAAGRQWNPAIEGRTKQGLIRRYRVQSSLYRILDRKVVEACGRIGRWQGLPTSVVEDEDTRIHRPRVRPDSREPRHLHEFGRGQRGLRREERGFKNSVLGRRKQEPPRRVEGIIPGGGKSRRPHQRRVEDRVRDRWRASLVARADTVRPDDVVVIDADRDRLRIAESVCGPVTAGARVVAVQTEDLVEEEQPPELDIAGIELAAEPGLERGVDPPGKAGLPQDMLKLAVQLLIVIAMVLRASIVARRRLGPRRRPD